MEENKINYRFLNYRQYDNFKADLDDGRILDDSIVFIQDRRRIWARGKEFNCNTDVQIEGNTINIVTSDGELVQTEDFVTVDDFNAFLSRYSDQVQESGDVVSLLEQKHDADVNTINNTIDRTIATHNNDMRNEINRATTAETALNDKLDQEIADRIADVNTEETRATTAENNLNNKLDQEIADRIADVNAEETRATTAETNLNSKLDDEIANRQTAVTTENNRAVAAENALDSKVNQEIADRKTAVTTEKNRAQDAESDLNDKIDQEISDRQSAVSAEQTRAQGVEQSHAQDIQALQNLIESDHDGVINKFNEIISFLNNIEPSSELQDLLLAISNRIDELTQTHNDDKQSLQQSITNLSNTQSGDVQQIQQQQAADKQEILTKQAQDKQEVVTMINTLQDQVDTTCVTRAEIYYTGS